MKQQIDGQEYEVIITRKNNKNTYTRVKEDLKIYVSTNYFVSDKQIIKMLDRNYDDIKKMISKINESKKKDDTFYYLGKSYDIIIVPTIDKIDICSNMILVKSEKDLTKWLNKEIKRIFKERLDICYKLFEEDIPYPNLKIRSMTSRWGVCNRKNLNVTLNSKLIRYDIEEIDYVIIHELSHFVHFDHSKDFWLTVYKYCPNYKEKRKRLKE